MFNHMGKNVASVTYGRGTFLHNMQKCKFRCFS